MRLPNTLLARTFLLTASLVLVTTVAWLGIFDFYAADPRARQAAEFSTNAVNTVRAALIAADPERRLAFFSDLSQREGIHLLPAEPNDKVTSLPKGRYWRILEEEILLRLGPSTQVAYALDDVPGLWVSFSFDEHPEAGNDDHYWVMLPQERAAPHMAMGWLLWSLTASLLSLAFAGFVASRLARPLKAMALAASSLGRGQTPAPLEESGPEEFQQLAATFNRMSSDLVAYEADRAEVLAGISHDLRTPLTRLRLEAEMSIADEAARQATVADIEQMESVISQFMDYARGDAGESLQVCDLNALLHNLIERQQALRPQLGVEISALPHCLLRPKAVQRAVANLLENAYKYGAEPVSLQVREENGLCVIEVFDHGPGIPPDQVDRVKRPFTRMSEARTDVTGTGLGLAIVERVARLHGGRLDLTLANDGSFVARLSLPIQSG